MVARVEILFTRTLIAIHNVVDCLSCCVHTGMRFQKFWGWWGSAPPNLVGATDPLETCFSTTCITVPNLVILVKWYKHDQLRYTKTFDPLHIASQGRSRSWEMTHTTHTVSELNDDFGRKPQNSLPLCIKPLPREFPFEFHSDCSARKNGSFPYQMVKRV